MVGGVFEEEVYVVMRKPGIDAQMGTSRRRVNTAGQRRIGGGPSDADISPVRSRRDVAGGRNGVGDCIGQTGSQRRQ